MSDNDRLMVLGLIELGQRSSGSEPWSLRVTHLPPAAPHTPSWERQRSVFPPRSQFLQLNQNSHGAKINVAIVGAKTARPDHGQCKEFQVAGPAGLLGSTDLIMRRANVVFQACHIKAVLFNIRTMGPLSGM